MRKILNNTIYLVIIIGSLLSHLQAQCPDNIDFELGDFSNWTGLTGSCCATPQVFTPGIVNGRHTIMTGPGVDPNVPLVPLISPNGGSYSVRLGNDLTGGEVDILRTTFLVTPTNTSFYYEYAIILQSPGGHQPTDMPKFMISIKDQNGQLVNCGQYIVTAGQGVPGFETYLPDTNQTWNVLEYKNWSGVNVDLSGYIGQNITVEFRTEDCYLYGHYGYAYIDLRCTGKLATIGALCQGDSVFQLVAPSGFASYLWTPGGYTGQSLNVANANPGDIFTVELTPFGDPNCKSYLSDTVNILRYNSSSTIASCPGVADGTATLTLLNDLKENYTFSWNTVPVQTALTATGLVGNQTYIVTITNSTGCLMYDTVFVDQLPLMQLITTTDSTSCYGGDDGRANVNVVGSHGNNTYLWSSTPTQDTQEARNLSMGSYIVVVRDDRGCTADATVFVAQPTEMQSDYAVKMPRCYTFSDGIAELYVFEGSPPYTYTWSTNPVQNTAKATGLAKGVYSYTIRDHKGCMITGEATMIDPPPIPKPIVFHDTICLGESANLKAYFLGDSMLEVFWYTEAANSFAVGSGLNYKSEPLFSNTIFFSDHMDHRNECYSLPRVPIFVTVNPLPRTEFETDRTFAEIPDAVINFTDLTDSKVSVIDRLWEFGDGNTSKEETPAHQYSEAGHYTVTLTTIDSLGCRNVMRKEHHLEIAYQVNLILPNAFTPNGDGINDFFSLEQKLLRSLHIDIFDRWGNRVFTSNDLNFRWDGTLSGAPLPEGTYVFHLHGSARDGEPVERSGSITLLR
jgi:gliding motility-associated-like protein